MNARLRAEDEGPVSPLVMLALMRGARASLLAGAFDVIVYRPGGTVEPGVATSWAQVKSAIRAARLRVAVLADDSIVSPAPVGASTGTTDGKGTTILAPFSGAGVSLEVQDGATLHDFAAVVADVGPLEVLCDAVTTPALSFARLSQFFVMGQGAVVAAGGGALVPVMNVPAGQTFLVGVTGDQSIVSNLGASAFAGLGAGATLQLDLVGTGSSAGYAGQVASGPAGSTLVVTHDDGSPDPDATTIGTFAGTVQDVRTSVASRLDPSGGPTLSRPTGFAVKPFQMYFDTDLGIPIWRTGAGGWVDATGAPR